MYTSRNGFFISHTGVQKDANPSTCTWLSKLLVYCSANKMRINSIYPVNYSTITNIMLLSVCAEECHSFTTFYRCFFLVSLYCTYERWSIDSSCFVFIVLLIKLY